MSEIVNIRNKFVEAFGEEEAERIEAAADSHANESNSQRVGSDPFKWALLICIGYNCLDKFATYHGIKTPWQTLKPWIIKNAELSSHNGDFDHLAMLAGTYDEFLGSEGRPQ
jgi:hypothetical protein